MAHRPTHLSELQPSFENVAAAQNQSVVHDFDVIAKEVSDGRLKLNPKDPDAVTRFSTFLQDTTAKFNQTPGMGPAAAADVSMEVPSQIYDPGTIRIPQGIQPAPPPPPPVIVPPPPVAQETLDSERRLQLMEEFRSRGLMPPGGFTTDELEQMLATRDIAVGGEEGIKERQSTATSPMRMLELMQRMGEEIYAPIGAKTGMGFWGPAPPEFLEAVEAERARGPMLGEVDPLTPEVRALRETSPEFFQMPIIPSLTNILRIKLGIPIDSDQKPLWTLGGAEAASELLNPLNLPPVGTAQFVTAPVKTAARIGTEASLGRLKAIPSRKIGKQPFPGTEDISADGPRALENAVRALDRLMTRDIAYGGTTPLGPEDIPTGGRRATGAAVGDLVTVFDPNGNPIEVKINAVSEDGGMLIELPDERTFPDGSPTKILEEDEYTAQSINERDTYTIDLGIQPGAEWVYKPVSDFTDEQLTAAFTRLDELVKATVGTIHNPGRMLPDRNALGLELRSRGLEVPTAPTVVPDAPTAPTLAARGAGEQPVIKIDLREPFFADDNAQSLADKLNALGEPNPLNPREVVIDGVAVGPIEVFAGNLRLNSLRSLEPGSGAGTRVLERITQMADEAGVTIEGATVPTKGVGGVMVPEARLRAFYKRHGFVFNDPNDPQRMVRTPRLEAETLTAPTVVPDVAPIGIQNIEIAQTGQPFTGKLFRGSGRETVEEVYDPHFVQGPIFGEAVYASPSRGFAGEFGSQIDEIEISLRNPLVISSDTEWRALTQESGLRSHVPIRPEEVTRLRQTIQAKRHDGVIVRVPESEAVGKRLQQAFGEDTVISFDPTITAPTVAPDEAVRGAIPDRPTTGTQFTLEGEQVVSPATRQRGEVVQAELDPALELDRQRRRAERADEAARVSARQPTFRLPQGLAKSSPRFGRFELAFDSDLDRALYIASSRKRSAARDQFEALLRGVFGEDADFVEIAKPLREQISDRVKRSKGDRPVQIPKVIDQPDVPRGVVSKEPVVEARRLVDEAARVSEEPVTPRATVIPEESVLDAPILVREPRIIKTDIGSITAQPGDSIEAGVSGYLDDIDEALKNGDQEMVNLNRSLLNEHLFGVEDTPGVPGTYEGGYVIGRPDIDDINNIIKGQETIGKGLPLGDDQMDLFLSEVTGLKDPRHFLTKRGTPKMAFRTNEARKRFYPVEKLDSGSIDDELAEMWSTADWQPHTRGDYTSHTFRREGAGEALKTTHSQDQFWSDLNNRIDELNTLDDLADEADRLGGTPRIQEILERNIIKKGERPERVVSRRGPSGVYPAYKDRFSRRGTLAGVLEPEDIGSRRSPEAGDRPVERRPFPGTRDPIDTGERLSPGAGSGIPEQRIQREAGGFGARDRWEGKPRTLADLRRESRGQRAFTPAQRADLADETHPINTKNIAWRIRDYDAPMELLKSQTKVPEYLMKLPSPIRRGLEVVDTARLSRNDPGKMAGIQHNLFVEIEKARVAISVLNFKNRAQKLFSFRKGIARRVEVAEGVSESTPGLRTLDDILDHPEHYVLTPEQNEVINIGIDTQTQSLRDAQRLGVDVIELGSAYWHRIIRKAPVEPAGEPRIIGILRRRKGYTYERALQGIDQLTEVSGKGFVYEQDPYIRMAARLEAAVESMAAVHLQRRLTQLPGAETFGQRISKDVSKAHRKAQESLLRAKANYRQKGGDLATKLEELRTAESIYLRAVGDLERAGKKAKTPGIGEVILYNRIIPADVKKQVEEFVGSLEGATEPNKITGILSETAQLLRTMLTTADLAAGFIQGQGLFYRNHPKWWTAQVHGVLGFVDDPTAYVARNFDVMQRGMEKGAIMRPTEFLFAERGLASVPPRIPLIGPALKGFNRAFEWFIVVAQTELFKAAESQLLKKGIKGKTLEEELVSVGTAIRKGVGGESPAILGLRQNQVTIERLAFFASRLLRANAGIIAQATLTPGAGGREARRILGSVIAGGTALTIGINLASTGRFPNFTDTDASDWGKFRVGKRLYSAFGPYHPYFRTIARSSNRGARGNITGALREIGRFFRSKASIPVRALETSAEMYTRGYSTTFEGEIIEPSLLGAARLASEYLPIAPVEAAKGIAEGEPSALTEFVGLQGQPESRTLFLQRKAQEITNTDRKLEDLLYPEFITVVQSLTAEETAALAELDRLAANRGNRYAENRIAQSNLDGIGGIDRDTETAVAGRLTRETDLLLDLFGRGQESGRWRFKNGKEQTVKSQFWAWYNAYRIMTNDIYSRKDQDRRRILGEDAITEEERPGNDQPNAQALYDLWDINDQITTDTGLRHSEKYWARYESLRNTWTPEQKAFIDEYRELKEHAPGVEEVLALTQTINKMSSVEAKKALDSIFRQYISDWQDTIKQFEVVKISASGEKQQQQIPEPAVPTPVSAPTETPAERGQRKGRQLAQEMIRQEEAGYPAPTPVPY